MILYDENADASTKEGVNQLAGSFGEVLEAHPLAHKGMTLLRPDGYVAYSSRDGDNAGAFTSMRSLLQRQTA